MGWCATTPSGDRELDARRNERVAWHRVLDTMKALTATAPDRSERARRQYETAKAVWTRSWLRLDQVRA